MKPILLAGSSLLVLSSCSITQESPVHIKGPVSYTHLTLPTIYSV